MAASRSHPGSANPRSSAEEPDAGVPEQWSRLARARAGAGLIFGALTTSRDTHPFRDVRSRYTLRVSHPQSASTASSEFAAVRFQPVGAGGHDDLVALLFAKTVFGKNAALVLGAAAWLAAAGFDALLLDSRRSRLARSSEQLDVGFAPELPASARWSANLGERVLYAQSPTLFASGGFAALDA